MTVDTVLRIIDTERERQGLSKQALCLKAGLSNAVLSNWQNGRCAPTVVALLDICEALGLKVTFRREAQ